MKNRSKEVPANKPQHTPGPWSTDGSFVWFKASRGGPDGDRWAIEIQTVKSASRPYEEMMANARLIAAAPELLSACKAWWAFMDTLPEGWLAHTSGDIGLLNDAYIKARAAIAKAEGR